LDELRVVVEQEAYGLLQPKLAGQNRGRFLDDGHRVSSCRIRLQKFFFPGGKKSEAPVQVPRAGATPKTFWAAESPKSGVAPARFGIFSAGHFFFGLTLSSCLSGTCVCHKVKDSKQGRVQDVVLTFFTGAPLPLHRKQQRA